MGPSGYEEEPEFVLIQRCSQGDRRAFDVLHEHYDRQIFHFVCVRVGHPEEADDLTQETFLRAWLALSKGTPVADFPPWLYQIARHLVSDWADQHRRQGVPEAWEDHLEDPAPGPSVEQAIELRWFWEFLERHLDEVFLHGADTPAGAKAGRLRKRAFLGFYVEGLTLPQIQAELTPHAQALGLSPPTPSQLNHWLSRGDLLTRLVRHLLQEHPDWSMAPTLGCLDQLSLLPTEAAIARLRWQESLPLEVIAERSGLSPGEVSHTVEGIVSRLIPLVSARLKARLHEIHKL